MIQINGTALLGPIIIIHDKAPSEEHILSEDALMQAIRNYVGKDIDLNKRIKIETRKISFAKFWGIYGRKENKEKAWKGWLKLKDEEIRLIFETLPHFIRKHKDVTYRPMPITYLNQKRWEDEIIPVSQQPSQRPSWVVPNDWGTLNPLKHEANI